VWTRTVLSTRLSQGELPVEHLHANFVALLNALVKAKPSAAKGKYVKKITLTSTMGPGLAVDAAEAQRLAEHV
jgi:large subunit ribosomal protein L1